jgi:hypothetical protein
MGTAYARKGEALNAIALSNEAAIRYDRVMFLTSSSPNLRRARVPVTPREYLDLVRALELDLSRTGRSRISIGSHARSLVKDERTPRQVRRRVRIGLQRRVVVESGDRGGRIAGGMAAQASPRNI